MRVRYTQRPNRFRAVRGLQRSPIAGTEQTMEPAPPLKSDSARRPVKARGWRWIVATAHALAERRVSPNAISLASVLACGTAGALMASTPLAAAEFGALWLRLFWLAAALLVLLRALCNVLDGMVAIERGVASPVGELWNELPDRLSDVAMLVGLGYAVGGSPTLGWAAAVAALLTAYVRAQCRAAGAPQDFRGVMSKPKRIAVVATCAGAMALLPTSVAAMQCGASVRWVGADHAWGVPAVTLAVVLVGSLLTSAGRVRRAAAALRATSRGGGPA